MDGSCRYAGVTASGANELGTEGWREVNEGGDLAIWQTGKQAIW